MSRLVVASNRVADIEQTAAAGGLAVAVGDALREIGGVWFGWSGEIVEDAAATGLNLERQSGVSIATQALTREEYDQAWVRWAKIHAIRGEDASAVAALERFRDYGLFPYWRQEVFDNPALMGLRRNPEYQALLDDYRAFAEEERVRARELLEVES